MSDIETLLREAHLMVEEARKQKARAERAEADLHNALEQRDNWETEALRHDETLARVQELRRQQFKAPGHVKEAEWINAHDLDRALDNFSKE